MKSWAGAGLTGRGIVMSPCSAASASHSGSCELVSVLSLTPALTRRVPRFVFVASGSVLPSMGGALFASAEARSRLKSPAFAIAARRRERFIEWPHIEMNLADPREISNEMYAAKTRAADHYVPKPSVQFRDRCVDITISISCGAMTGLSSIAFR